MACWARPPSIELMAHGHLLVSAPGFQGEKGGEEKSPQIITQPGGEESWHVGIRAHWPGLHPQTLVLLAPFQHIF